MTYAEADQSLQGRNRESRKIANNTYLHREGEDIAIRLHNTDIVRFKPNGDIVLDSGGWLTVTTKQRMNEYLRRDMGEIWSERGVWYVALISQKDSEPSEFTRRFSCFDCKKRWEASVELFEGTSNLSGEKSQYCPKCGKKAGYASAARKIVPFADGMVIHPDTSVEGAGEDPKAKLKLKKQISQYVADYMRAMERGEVPPPSGGDCWYCCMRPEQTGTVDIGLHKAKQAIMGNGHGKQTLGEAFKDTNHILGHIEEKYYVPSLLHRAIELFPISQAAKWWIGSFWATGASEQERLSARGAGATCKDHVAKALTRYLNRQLGMAA